jgi:predicted transcriptional regulator
MRGVKTKLSVTVARQIAQMLEDMAAYHNTSKSALVEKALHDLFEEQMVRDAKKLASIKFDDLPTEDEWIELQPKWEW